jgi:hypothetical protein
LSEEWIYEINEKSRVVRPHEEDEPIITDTIGHNYQLMALISGEDIETTLTLLSSIPSTKEGQLIFDAH